MIIVAMVASVAKKPVQNKTMVICDHYGIVWQTVSISFWVNLHFQNRHLTSKNCIEPL